MLIAFVEEDKFSDSLFGVLQQPIIFFSLSCPNILFSDQELFFLYFKGKKIGILVHFCLFVFYFHTMQMRRLIRNCNSNSVSS
jgi:hypothetical protein